MELFTTNHWVVKLSDEQYYLGRCVVILKRDCPELSLLTKEEFLDLLKVIIRLESTFKKKFNATMFNWTCLMNDAYKKKSEEKPQVHWHFRPRYNNPITIGGLTFIDEDFAHHYNRERKKVVSVEILGLIRDKFLN